MRRSILRLAGLLATAFLCACATNPANHPYDPLENVNRGFWAFNEGLDQYVARPIAQGYVQVVPDTAQQGIHNFISNVDYSTTVLNDLLQGKITQFFQDAGRLAFNTIVGIGGFVDAANMIGLEEHKEDFGQTLGVWGVGDGAYLMMPLYGPTTTRDFIGVIFDTLTSPGFHIPMRASAPLDAVAYVDERANLLVADAILAQQPDTYIFVRGAYLQNRINMLYDGSPPIDTSEFDNIEQDNSNTGEPSTPAESTPAPLSETPTELLPETTSAPRAEAPTPDAASEELPTAENASAPVVTP